MATFSASRPGFNPLTTTHTTLSDTYYAGANYNSALVQAENAAWKGTG